MWSAASADLRGAREIELVPLDAVDIDLVGWEEARAVHRRLADEHGREDGHEPVADEPVEREAVERELEERDRARAVGEARAGETGAALHVDPAGRAREVDMVANAFVLARITDAADLLCVLLRRPVRRRLVGRVRNLRQELTSLLLGFRELALEPLEVGLDRLQLLDLLGRGLALELGLRAKLVDLRHERKPAPVHVHERVEGIGRSLARERRAPRIRVLASRANVDHARSL